MTALPRALFDAPLPGLGRSLTRAEGDRLDKYLNLLTKWQRTHRLVGSVDRGWMVENVFLDSLCFLEAVPPGAARVADIGSGAGLPGIPIALVRPDLTVSLIEARQRRASFLSTVVRELALDHVEVVPARVEALGEEYVGRFDAVVMRCAGEISAVLGNALRLIHDGGVVVVSSAPADGPPLEYRAGSLPVEQERVGVRTLAGTVRSFYRLRKHELGH